MRRLFGVAVFVLYCRTGPALCGALPQLGPFHAVRLCDLRVCRSHTRQGRVRSISSFGAPRAPIPARPRPRTGRTEGEIPMRLRLRAFHWLSATLVLLTAPSARAA